MDFFTKIMQHTVELLNMRGEDTTDFEKQLADVYGTSLSTVTIPISTSDTTVFYVFNEKSLIDLWKAIKKLTVEEMEKEYHTKNFILIVHDYELKKTIKSIYEKSETMLKKGGRLDLFLLKELMYNPTKHVLVPKHKKLTAAEVEELMTDLQLKKSMAELPFILRTDIIARWLGLKQGDIVRITRYSETSGKSYFYRRCV